MFYNEFEQKRPTRADIGSPAVTKIVLIAGPVRAADRPGHHDYAAGCALLADLLARVEGVRPIVAYNGWPDDQRVFDHAAAVLFYDSGGGKQGFLQNAARIGQVQNLVDAGCGIVMLHQAVGFPAARAALGQSWIGGVYVAGASKRGHWKARHHDLPVHPVTEGVAGWSMRDGWLSDIRFLDGRRGLTPLLWSARRFRRGGPNRRADADIVAWTHERANRGRAFVFTGLDSHVAWMQPNLRLLIANGVLWAAHHPIPRHRRWVDMQADRIAAYRTPRRSPARRAIGSLARKLRRAARGDRKW